MTQLKKISALSLLLLHSLSFADDMGAIIGAGAAALACIGGTYAYTSHKKNVKKELHKEMQKTIELSVPQIQEKSQYGQKFDVQLSNVVSIEEQLEATVTQLGKRLQSINKDNKISSDVRNDLQSFITLQQKIDTYSSCADHQAKDVSAQLLTYQTNAKKLLSVFDKHAKFFKGHRILNSYESIPETRNSMELWICSHAEDMMYPLSSYKQQVDRDVQFIEGLESTDFAMYPTLAVKLTQIKYKIEQSVVAMYQTGKIQKEIQQKHDNEVERTRVQVMHDEVRAKLKALDDFKRHADAQEDLARQERIKNENKSREIVALREANRIKEMRIPIELARLEQERERTRLELRINNDRRGLEEQQRIKDRLQSENRTLERKNNELQKHAEFLQRTLNQCRKNCEKTQGPTPSAPFAPGSSVPNIGSAQLRPPAQNPNYRP